MVMFADVSLDNHSFFYPFIHLSFHLIAIIIAASDTARKDIPISAPNRH